MDSYFLPPVDRFTWLNNKYSTSIISTYQVMRDLVAKGSLSSLDIIDGEKYGINDYLLKWIGMDETEVRMYILLSSDDSIDIGM